MNLEDYNEYYIQGSDHYLIPKDVFKELFHEMVNWKEESQKKKEVIDKIFSRITLWKMEDITMETSKVLDDLLDILKEVSE